MCVFVFVNVQERIFKKRTKNHEKMTKRARDLEKCQKPEPGKLVVIIKAHKIPKSPLSFKEVQFNP